MFGIKKEHLKIRYAQKSHTGGREDNQDFCGRHADENSNRYCFALADGLGGHAGGRTAAEVAINSIIKYFDRITKENVLVELKNAVLFANLNILEQAASDHRLRDMQSTCVVLVIFNQNAFWTTIGDSRIYVFRKGKIIQKSRDHSIVQMLLDMKKITESEVRGHPVRNQILKSLGGGADPEPEIASFVLKKGDQALLCSDGFWELFMDDELAEFFVDHARESEQEKIDKLFEMALKKGIDSGKRFDNLTAQLISVGR